jgi:SAM-dependent methyltransferase
MLLNMKWFFRLAYLKGGPRWDTGVPPPELVDVVEGAHVLPPGRALDLGCGTGTNTVYLARHGWDVSGVDFIGQAVQRARRRAEEAGVHPRIVRGDVTRLADLALGDGFTLLFDLGCYSAIPQEGRDGYVDGVTALAAPRALFLMYGMAPRAGRLGPLGLGARRDSLGVTADELRERFRGWDLVEAVRGSGPWEVWWYQLRRRQAPD